MRHFSDHIVPPPGGSGTLRQQKDSPVWGAEVRALLSDGISQPKKGVDVGDHPPITPMRLATPQMLDSEAWKVYDYVVRHFIGASTRRVRWREGGGLWFLGGRICL